MSAETLLTAVEVTILTTAVALTIGIIARRLRMPYTVGLVIVGSLVFAAVSWLRQLPSEEIPSLVEPFIHILDQLLDLETDAIREAIFVLFVPPLVFEAAFHLRFERLRQDLLTIFLFAIPGVVITTLLVGWVVAEGVGISFTTAVVFGALIAATDPVAVVSLFRSLNAPKRLQVLIEGESLLNDGAAIVIFGIALGIATGRATFALHLSILDFFVVAGGGLIIGGALGWLVSTILGKLDDYLIETALTFTLAFGAYLLAESIHVSGVLAVVASGLVLGNIGPRQMSPTTRLTIINFWEFIAFLANTLVFLLIGLVVDITQLLANWQAILWAIATVLLVRAIVIFTFSALTRTIPWRWRFVLFWGGLRGAISLALVLGLGARFAELQAMTFGVVLFTLLIQGTTMGPILHRLGIVRPDDKRKQYKREQARSVALRSAQERLREYYQEGMVSKHTWDVVAPVLETYTNEVTSATSSLLEQDPALAVEERDTAWRETLRVQRATLHHLLADGVISEDIYEELVTSIDAALNSQNNLAWAELSELKSGLGVHIPADVETDAQR